MTPTNPFLSKGTMRDHNDMLNFPPSAIPRKDMIPNFQDGWRWLSNFLPTPVVYEGVTYPSAENAYQAAKTLDQDERLGFRPISPAGAKKRGRKNSREITLREDWDQVKLEVMRAVVRDKFTRNHHLRDLLLRTRELYLREGNHWRDFWWGTDYAGKGENHLGRILMDLRREFQGQPPGKPKLQVYVIWSPLPDYGIFIGAALGMGFWSKADPADQDVAVCFNSPEEAKAFVSTWEHQPEEWGTVPVTITAPDDPYRPFASKEECEAAGLPRWENKPKAALVSEVKLPWEKPL